MATYLFTWNPLKSPQRRLAAELDSIRGWSVGGNRRIVPGDRFFLLRQRLKPTGVVASGQVTSMPWRAEHWDDERRKRAESEWYVDVDFDQPPSEIPLIPWGELRSASLGAFRWGVRRSGVRLPEDIAEALHARWSAVTRRAADEREDRGGPIAHHAALPADTPGWYSAEEYAAALGAIEPRVSALQRRMLAAHATAPDLMLTVTQLAAAAGFEQPQVVYSQYGRLGHLLAQAFSHQPQEVVWTRMLASDGKKAGELAWRMEPALARALLQMGWARGNTISTGQGAVGTVRGDSRYSTDLFAEIDAAEQELATEPETSRRALILSRIGQGIFRSTLFEYWSACALTGLTEPAALRASHIKPWRESSNSERLDCYNGLLLAAHLDALFDAALISFEDDGTILISRELTPHTRKLLGISPQLRLRAVDMRHLPFLAHHRARFLGHLSSQR